MTGHLTGMSQKYGCLPAFGSIKTKLLLKMDKQHQELCDTTYPTIGGPPPIVPSKLLGNKVKFNIRIEDPKVEMRVNFQKLLPKLRILAANSQENQYRSRFESNLTGITAATENSQGEVIKSQIPEIPEPPKMIKLGKRIKNFAEKVLPTIE